jgi:polyisoprenoid-binding protein YceI
VKKFFKILQLGLIAVMLLSFSSNGITQKNNSTITFRIKNAGLNVDGKFTKFYSKIDFNENNPESSSFFGSIDIASINTGISMRDDHLKKEEYFDVEKYPKMTFESTSVKEVSKNKLEIVGKLSIKNVTKNIKIQVDVIKKGSGHIFKSSFVINRRTFDVGGKSWTMADRLTVNLSIVE